ncbi:MAG: formylglycine-generating enzyme family protein [Psychrobium sp.]
MKYITKTLITTFVVVGISGCGGSGSDKIIMKPEKPPAPVTPPTNEHQEMITIPATTFRMGCNQDDGDICLPGMTPHIVSLDSYSIDKYMVTYERYQACIESGQCTKPFEGAACNYGMEWADKHPVNCITFQQAEEVCSFENKRLPTEAEWALAARGPNSLVFPWGNETAPSCDVAVLNQKRDGKMGPGCGAGTTMEVGSKPDGQSPFGLMDVTGNLWEWTSDWYSETYFGESPEANPQGPATGTHKVLRGSSWTSRRYDELALTIRFAYAPKGQGYVIGARCAADL